MAHSEEEGNFSKHFESAVVKSAEIVSMVYDQSWNVVCFEYIILITNKYLRMFMSSEEQADVDDDLSTFSINM